MKTQTNTKHLRKSLNERGAALLTTLLLSTLLLAAGGTLVVSTSLSATTAIDSTAEMQAYAAAEAGLEAALDVFRGNVTPTGITPTTTKMSFINARAKSNKTLDTSNQYRFSAWLAYDSTYTTVVPITANYTPQNGFGYRISIVDPDNHALTAAPSQLVITSTGVGPKGATKILEMVVKPGSFDFNAPATITLRGADDGTAMNFSLGGTPIKHYSGQDNANPSATNLPAFATTNADTRAATTVLASGVTTVTPHLGVLPIDTSINPTATSANAAPTNPVNPAPPNVAKVPSFLQSADLARTFLNTLQAKAVADGRYFTSWSGASGTTASPAFTFIDGNATVSGGAGLLVVTGNLILHENVSFSGLVLVLGNGSISREGGGPGTFSGALVVAKFDRTWPANQNALSHPFLAPSFSAQHDDGNIVTMQYDSAAVASALELSGITVVHVRER
jgi:hypothetical protein